MIMFPELSNGAINWIINGANVVNAVIQILDCKKITGAGNDRYRLLISDGVTGFPLAILGAQLNHMVTNNELEKFTIVQMNKYVCHQIQTDKVIILLSLTVLVPGNKVNEKLGNPVDSSTNDVSIIATNISAINCDEKCSSNDNAAAAHETSMFSFPQLTLGAISRILNGEDVANAVVQILGFKKIAGTPDRFHLLIFDGVTGWPFVMLGTHLNRMVYNQELEKFTTVQVDKYVYNQETVGQKMIILLKITILSPGNDGNEKFRSPIGSSLSGEATNAPAANFVAKTDFTKQHAASAHYLSMITGYTHTVLFTQFLHTMFPEVASGAINRILNGEDVTNAVIQILGCKKIPGAGNDRYRLLISDGVTGFSLAMLGTQLTHMVTNNELEKFTIVRVEKYVCNQIQADREVIILLNLTVLVPGNEVNEKLGNPVMHQTVNDFAEAGYSNDNAVATQDSSKTNGSSLSVPFDQLYITLPQLTTGAINQILNGEDVAGASIQILCLRKIPKALDDRYRLLISDGITSCPFAMLGTQLNHMITNNELRIFTIVRVEKYVCNQVLADQKVIILLNLTVLVPGDVVNKMLGNPVSCTSD